MTDSFDRRAPNRTRAQLEAARTAGAWMPWAGAALALLLWGGLGVWLYASIGLAALLAQPPAVLAGGLAAVIAPGLALICAGVMARESARSAQANAIVLTSARLLLEPAEHAREEASSIAESVSAEAYAINRALGETRARLEDLKREIESSASDALKASEIVRADSEVVAQRMGAERQRLSELAELLRKQAEDFTSTMPHNAQMIADAARAAQEQVRTADDTLAQRLQALEETAAKLAQRIDQLDTMGAESRKRAQNLSGALARLDEQLVQSTRMVEAATKAGELASAASKSTADSLRDAVSDALSAALKATEEINERSAQAAEDAQHALERLREAGLQVETITRAASLAAQAQAEAATGRLRESSEQGAPGASLAEDGLERARKRIERASLLIGQMKEEPQPSRLDDLVIEPEPAPSNDFLLEPPARSAPNAHHPAPKPTASADFEHIGRREDEDELVLREIDQSPWPEAQSKNAANPSSPDLLFAPEPPRPASLSWRDLLSGMDAPQAEKRDRTAGLVIDELDRAGVRLGVVTATDLRRIASAAHQGERHRRRAIRDIAPIELQRVTRLLDADRELRSAARAFVAFEEPEALKTLSMSEHAHEDAGPRLSAFLLLDAALGAAR